MSTRDLHSNDEQLLSRFFEPENVATVAEPNVDALANQIHPETLRFPEELMAIFLQAAKPGNPS